MGSKPAPVVIVKKKGAHGGHHGGAWKVAYADFVTAMMALFIVLWLMNTNKQVQEAVGGYFKDPSGAAKKTGSSLMGSGESLVISKQNMADLREGLLKKVRKVADFEKVKDHIEMTVTAEGLRIDLLESDQGTFFDSGSPRLKTSGEELLIGLAQELGGIPNVISIEGHTDARVYANGRDYGNWELSADRANAARRLMQGHGLRPNQVSQVRGYADQKLRDPARPQDAANRRISLVVHYGTQAEGAGAGESPQAPSSEKPTAQ
jgi:chemotaxis protein MotB